MDSEPGGRGQHDLQCRGDDTSSKDRANAHSQANPVDSYLDAHASAFTDADRHPHTDEEQGDQNANSAPRVAHGLPAVAGRANSHPQACAATGPDRPLPRVTVTQVGRSAPLISPRSPRGASSRRCGGRGQAVPLAESRNRTLYRRLPAAAILALIPSTDGSVAASNLRETGGGMSRAVTLAMGQSR